MSASVAGYTAIIMQHVVNETDVMRYPKINYTVHYSYSLA